MLVNIRFFYSLQQRCGLHDVIVKMIPYIVDILAEV